jgi:predicted dehydrogenase
VVYAEGTWLMAGGFNMAYTVLCERATIDYDLARGAEALRITETGKAPRVVKCDGSDGYTEEISYMLQAILSGKAPRVVTAQDGLSAIQICEAEAKSVRTGRIVSLS